ncbi:adenylate/guanylate cyclase domain-containing protein [Agrobacterium cavarae]|uniref:adenylate/guanylate cyclase domain-containing protein n=1 Tax=Agrobacterium cavarae TaxID=2528239 RepID=UPI003EE64878
MEERATEAKQDRVYLFGPGLPDGTNSSAMARADCLAADRSMESRLIAQESKKDILRWLTEGCSQYVLIENLLADLCLHLVHAGLPISQASMIFTIDHPQWLAARILWKPEMQQAALTAFEHGSLGSIHYDNSFVQQIHDGCDIVRKRIERIDMDGSLHPFYRELRDDGVTDFSAWLLLHTQGRRHIVAFSTDRIGGFDAKELDFIGSLIPILALVTEVRLKNRFARTLLETYVGPQASREILAGAVTRGTGRTLEASILVCDLRGFSRISGRLPHHKTIDLLNEYFDAVGEPIERFGGEILKFMGDGLLAIFPSDGSDTPFQLLKGVHGMLEALASLNERRRWDTTPLRQGIGVHSGEVVLGNIGSRNRLDFTVIGSAVNVASRLEGLTRVVDRPVLFSKAFVDSCQLNGIFENLGRFPLSGMKESIEVFGLASR